MQDYEIIRKFTSRKNEVFLIKREGKLSVMKKFASYDSAKNEWVFLSALNGRFNAPEPIAIDGNVLIMAYVPGALVHDLLNAKTLKMLASWMANLHMYGISKGDCTLRNFIISKQGICGIDWEEADTSEKFKKDLSEICGNIIMLTDDFKLCCLFLNHYSAASHSANIDIKDELVLFLKSRITFRPDMADKVNSLASRAVTFSC
ncbi:MAG: RIO1 family regulatory kinase/ATPase [Nitrososphaeria archaeon]